MVDEKEDGEGENGKGVVGGARRWLTRRRMERVRMEKMLWEEPLAKADIPSLTLAPTSTLFNLVPDLPTFASTASTSSSPASKNCSCGAAPKPAILSTASSSITSKSVFCTSTLVSDSSSIMARFSLTGAFFLASMFLSVTTCSSLTLKEMLAFFSISPFWYTATHSTLESEIWAVYAQLEIKLLERNSSSAPSPLSSSPTIHLMDSACAEQVKTLTSPGLRRAPCLAPMIVGAGKSLFSVITSTSSGFSGRVVDLGEEEEISSATSVVLFTVVLLPVVLLIVVLLAVVGLTVVLGVVFLVVVVAST